MGAGEIIVGHRRFACAVPVVPWSISGQHFEGLPMRESADLVCLCWSMTDETAPNHFKSLRSRFDKQTGKTLGMSAHFYCDHAGRVTQFCDALSRVRFLPRGNDRRSVIVELSNRATPIRLERGITREVVVERVNGETSARTTFTAPQMRSAIALCEALCAALSIPCVVPMDGADVCADVLPEAFLASYRGVCCRFHFEARRSDAGLAILRRLAAKSIRGRAELDG